MPDLKPAIYYWHPWVDANRVSHQRLYNPTKYSKVLVWPTRNGTTSQGIRQPLPCRRMR
jgi:hypothetical protein